MQKKEVPRAAATKNHHRAFGSMKTTARGLEVLNSPQLNKGTAFSAEERQTLHLTGLLPPEIGTLENQVRRAWIQYERLPDALGKNIYLTALHDRNEVLFFRLFSEHLREMIPIVNDQTVGLAIEQYHHECRRPRGIYLSINHIGGIDEAFSNLQSDPGDIDLILATDAEKVPGVGDCGIGGIEVAIGKLAIYTAAGGLDPARVIPVMLDAGTDRESLREDRLYVGNRHPRVRGERYDAFIEAYVVAATKRFPNALLQWEDFASETGVRILAKYRSRIGTFNEDIQGTGAIVLAAAISAARVCGTPMRSQRVVIFGAGIAGLGCADRLRDAMVREGLPQSEAVRRFWCVDREGLQTDGQHQYARPAAESKRSGGDLADVVRRVKPTMLIGASSASGAFTEAIVRDMAAHTERPIIFVLSSPPVQAEANPSDLIAWTDGRALLATGSSFAPVTRNGITYVIAQTMNAMLYPGLALGAIVSQARLVSDGMFVAAANALSSLVTVRQPGASLLPQVDDLRSVSTTVAVAVAEAASSEKLARAKPGDLDRQVRESLWTPEYRPILAI
jgi:malate dehydrogenase (oxaloacetate-decarboxylating)